jgi:polar amino acid transport system substrate-binding protein
MDILSKQIISPILHRLLASLTGLTLFSIVITGCNSLLSDFKSDKNQPGSANLTSIPPPGSSTIRLANGEWIPYTGKELSNAGCDSRVVTEAFSNIGYTVVYDFFPWARAYHLAETGEWDGTLEWADTPEHRSAFYISSEPLSDQEWVFFFRKDRPFQWESLDDLNGKIVGITSGYVYSDAFKALIDKGNITFEEASTDEANFKKILSGRIDVFPMERNVGIHLIKSTLPVEDQDKIVYYPKPFHEFYPYLLMSKTNPLNANRMEQFNTSLHNLKNSEKYKEIMQDCLD